MSDEINIGDYRVVKRLGPLDAKHPWEHFVWCVYAKDAQEPLSTHSTQYAAKAAIKRYQAADKRRAR